MLIAQETDQVVPEINLKNTARTGIPIPLRKLLQIAAVRFIGSLTPEAAGSLAKSRKGSLKSSNRHLIQLTVFYSQYFQEVKKIVLNQ